MTAPRAAWLTIDQICAELQVSETEWNAWRTAGDTPLHVVMPDGQLRVRAADLERWLDTLTDDNASPRASADASRSSATDATPAPFRPLSAYWRQRIRDAIDRTGDRGLGRAEIWALTSRDFSLRQINGALAELLASEAYEQLTVRTGATGRPPVRYRRRDPSHAARAYASRGTVAERDGQR
jgi:hypothetical protein